MKKTATFLVVAVALFSSADFVFSQAVGFTATLDEFGNTNVFDVPGPQVDPASGLTTLSYFSGSSLVNGDLVLNEGGVPTELIRFEDTNGPMGGTTIFFYSLTDDGADAPLADTVNDISPLLNSDNTVSMDETGVESGPNGLFGYTPRQIDPGFDTSGYIASYDITSDPISSVPEVSTWLAPSMAGALLIAGFFRRRRAA